MRKKYDSFSLQRRKYEDLVWPETEESALAQKFLTPLIKNGVPHYIDNINAKINILKVGSCVLPIAIIDEHYDNSYVCSPYGHYVLYALDSKHLFERKSVKMVIDKLVHKLERYCAMGK